MTAFGTNLMVVAEEELAPASSLLPHISSRRNLKYRPCGNILYIEDSTFEIDLRTKPIFQHAVNEASKHPKSQGNRQSQGRPPKNPFGPPTRSDSWNKVQSPARVQEGLRSPVHQSTHAHNYDHINYQPFYQQMMPTMNTAMWNSNWNAPPAITFQSTHQPHQQHYPYQYANYTQQNPYFQGTFFPQISTQSEDPPGYEASVNVSYTTSRKRRNSQDHHHNSAWLSPPPGGMMSPQSSFGEREMSVGEFSVTTSFDDDVGGIIPRGPEMKRSRSANSRRREVHA